MELCSFIKAEDLTFHDALSANERTSWDLLNGKISFTRKITQTHGLNFNSQVLRMGDQNK